MSKTVVINVDLDKPCRICGKGGATDSGRCMECTIKLIDKGAFDHIFEASRKRLKEQARQKKK